MTQLTDKQRIAIQAAIALDQLSSEHQLILKELIGEPNNRNNKGDLYVDGAADLHSKTAGIGGAIFLNESEIQHFSRPLFDKTNNEAEYMSMIEGVKVSLEINLSSLNIYSDSELVVKQVNGQYKIKNDRMLRLCQELKSELDKLDSWQVTHIRREKNTRADALSKEGMAEAKKTKK